MNHEKLDPGELPCTGLSVGDRGLPEEWSEWREPLLRRE